MYLELWDALQGVGAAYWGIDVPNKGLQLYNRGLELSTRDLMQTPSNYIDIVLFTH